jgi:hypothetical protein
MKTYLATFEYRKGGSKIRGPFLSFESAQNAVLEVLNWSKQDWQEYKDYDSSFEKGTICTEDFSVEIYEREQA